MGSRIYPFENHRYYHIYNRGVDKRQVFLDKQDVIYFLEGLNYYNQEDTTERLNLARNKEIAKQQRLVDLNAFALVQNHFHILVRQRQEDGVSKFMQKLGTSYTKYFNKKYNRSGSLFQGKFKSKLVVSDAAVRYVSAYVHRNDIIHNIDVNEDRLFVTSIKEPIQKELVPFVPQTETAYLFTDMHTRKLYETYAKKTAIDIFKQREEEKDRKSTQEEWLE